MIGLYMPLTAQSAYFLEAVLLGAVLGLIYDVFAVVRSLTRAGAGLTALCDGLFWLTALAVYFVFTVAWAGGQVRGFLLLGCGLGALFFELTLSPLIRVVLTAVIRTALRLMFGVCHLLARVLGAVFCPLKALYRGVREKFSKKIQKNTSIS